MQSQSYQLGNFIVDFTSGIVKSANADDPAVDERLEPKTCAVLYFLVLHHNTIISKEKIISEV